MGASGQIEMADTGGSAAMAPDPSRHGFWAWKQRLLTASDSGAGDHVVARADGHKYSRSCFWAWKQRLLTASDPGAGDHVAARADGHQCSRSCFLCWCTLFNFLLVIGSTLLMIYVQPPTAGQAVFVATRVLGYSGLAASLCLACLLTHLWNAVATGDRNDQRMIDSLMDCLV